MDVAGNVPEQSQEDVDQEIARASGDHGGRGRGKQNGDQNEENVGATHDDEEEGRVEVKWEGGEVVSGLWCEVGGWVVGADLASPEATLRVGGARDRAG